MSVASNQFSKQLLYFDNNATTPLDPEVIEEMLPYITDFYANPASGYGIASQVKKAVEQARAQVAALLGAADPREIVFTSCGTEGANTALESAIRMQESRKRRHIVTTRIEHSAVKVFCEKLAQQGHEVTWLGVDSSGQPDLDEVQKAIRNDTAVVSAMWANNETGVIFPVKEVAQMAREKGAFFYTDAVQAVGKVPIQLSAPDAQGIQMLSLSGHKLHAPKGVGALYVSRQTAFTPYLIGGDQEEGRRAGTLNVASIIGLGKAAEVALRRMESDHIKLQAMRDHFEERVLAEIPRVTINGAGVPRLPNTSNLSFEGIQSEGLMILLDKNGVCVSAGSACHTGSPKPSHVLTAMGRTPDQAHASLRVSFSRFNTPQEVERGIEILVRSVVKLRGLLGGA